MSAGVACAPLTPLYLPASQPTAFPPSPTDLLQYYHFAPIARVPSVRGPGLYRGAIADRLPRRAMPLPKDCRGGLHRCPTTLEEGCTVGDGLRMKFGGVANHLPDAVAFLAGEQG